MSRWTCDDMPDQAGRVAIVTGANSGLGFECSRALARAGATVILACRDRGRGEAARVAIEEAVPGARVLFMVLDLAESASIAAFAEAFSTRFARLDVLLNNAGIMMTPAGATADGFERQLGTNHYGHFALTGRLIRRLGATPGSRIVNVSSIAASAGHFDFGGPEPERYDTVQAYNRSKLANLLFTRELHARLVACHATAPIAIAAHPGVASTALLGKASMPWHYRLMRPVMLRLGASPAEGARHLLYAATMADVRGGDYIGPGGLAGLRGDPGHLPMPATVRPAWQRALWSQSERLTGVKFGLADAISVAAG